MCDYSLHDIVTRPAKVGDKLTSTSFNRSISRGFCAVGEPNLAVCLVPGTELAFEREVECDPAIPFFRNRRLGHKVARFRQINMQRRDLHHDALEFPDGKIVLVTKLTEGQLRDRVAAPGRCPWIAPRRRRSEAAARRRDHRRLRLAFSRSWRSAL